jgi:hypothetical protein
MLSILAASRDGARIALETHAEVVSVMRYVGSVAIVVRVVRMLAILIEIRNCRSRPVAPMIASRRL